MLQRQSIAVLGKKGKCQEEMLGLAENVQKIILSSANDSLDAILAIVVSYK